MFTGLFFIILAIILADFLLDRYLEYINIKHSDTDLPDELQGIYEEERYARQREYQKVNYRFDIWSSAFNLVLILGMLLFYGFAWVNGLAASISVNPIPWARLMNPMTLTAEGPYLR